MFRVFLCIFRPRTAKYMVVSYRHILVHIAVTWQCTRYHKMGLSTATGAAACKRFILLAAIICNNCRSNVSVQRSFCNNYFHVQGSCLLRTTHTQTHTHHTHTPHTHYTFTPPHTHTHTYTHHTYTAHTQTPHTHTYTTHINTTHTQTTHTTHTYIHTRTHTTHTHHTRKHTHTHAHARTHAHWSFSTGFTVILFSFCDKFSHVTLVKTKSQLQPFCYVGSVATFWFALTGLVLQVAD
jgi:hypothetical protein